MFKLFCISLNYLIVLAQYMPSSLLEYLEKSCSVATRSGFAPMPMLQNVVCKKKDCRTLPSFIRKPFSHTLILACYLVYSKTGYRIFIVSDRGDHFTWQNIYLYFYPHHSHKICVIKNSQQFAFVVIVVTMNIILNLWYHWKNNYIDPFQTCLQILVCY